MTRFRPLGHGPIEVAADLCSRSERWENVQEIMFPSTATDDAHRALRDAFGKNAAAWMALYSAHIGEFTTANFLQTTRRVHARAKFKWASATKGFAALRGLVGAVMVLDGADHVFVFSSPQSRPRAFAAIMLQDASPDDEDVLSVYEQVVGPLAREMPAGAPSRVIERWHTPTAISFFAAHDDAWFEWSVEDGYVTCERASS